MLIVFTKFTFMLMHQKEFTYEVQRGRNVLFCLQSWPGGGAGHAASPGCYGPGHSKGASPLPY